MPIKDRLSGRVSLSGNNRSKALNITKRAWELNVQNYKVKTPAGQIIRLRTSVKTMKTLLKEGKVQPFFNTKNNK